MKKKASSLAIRVSNCNSLGGRRSFAGSNIIQQKGESIVASDVSCADAELVAAGVEFRALHERYIEARRLSQPNWDAHDAARRSGELQSIDDIKRIDEKFPLPVPCCEDITDAMDPVVNRIMALPATTVDGLNAKAEVVRHCYEKGFNEEFDADAPWDDGGTVRALVEAVSALANRAVEASAA